MFDLKFYKRITELIKRDIEHTTHIHISHSNSQYDKRALTHTQMFNNNKYYSEYNKEFTVYYYKYLIYFNMIQPTDKYIYDIENFGFQIIHT